MRIIIGNHIDDSILLKRDNRIFTQRVIWFAEDGDMIILPTKPDEDFLQHVTSLTGVNASSLKFLVPPQGRFDGKHIDSHSLTDNMFLSNVKQELDNVTEIIPVWPSPAVARFTEKIGKYDCLPGINFISQNGAELSNNKATFRVLAAAAKIPIALGEVCYGIKDAELVIKELLSKSGAVMVKQAHNGAGSGNEIVIQDPSLEIDHTGAKFYHHLRKDDNAIRDYLELRWNWASAEGKFPVIIEEFIPSSQTIYAEFYSDDSGVRHSGSGRLCFTGRRLTKEITPLRGVPEDVHKKLLYYGERLASIYHSIGYRGYLSADAIINETGKITFTEMNARIGTSLNLYDSIARRVVEAHRKPERTIVQYNSPRDWAPIDFKGFLSALKEIGCLYDPKQRKGVIISLPILPEGGFVTFCTVYETENEEHEINQVLNTRFSKK